LEAHHLEDKSVLQKFAIGETAMATLTMQGTRTRGVFWFIWVISSTLGWIVGFFSTFLLMGTIGGGEILDSEWGFMIGLTIIFTVGGTCLGTAQWLLLRRMIPRAKLWILGYTLGFATLAILYFLLTALNLPEIVSKVIHNGLGGVVVGLVQLRVLQPHVRNARWWIPVMVGGMLLAGFTEYFFLFLGFEDVIGAIVGLILMSILTGRVLITLFLQNNVTVAAPGSAHA
jgi:hypothetical protein